MKLTKTEYIEQQKKECEEASIKFSDIIESEFDNEYYNLICDYMKLGNKLEEKIYNSLSESQKWHFNKHYNNTSEYMIIKEA